MNTILPVEIITIILSKINDNNTYKNARLTCKCWTLILKDGKNFKNNKLYSIIKFNNDSIDYYSPYNILLAQVKFSSYGYYEYKTFNKNCIINVKSSPFKLQITTFIGTYFEKKTYDIFTDKKNIVNHYIPQCNLM